MKIVVLTLPEESHVKPFLHLFDYLTGLKHEVTIYIKDSHRAILHNPDMKLKIYNQYFLDYIFNFGRNLSPANEQVVPKNRIARTEPEKKGQVLEASYLYRWRCIKKYLKNLEEDFSQYDLLLYDYYLYFGYVVSKTYGLTPISLIPTLLPCGSIRDENLDDFLRMNYVLDTDKPLFSRKGTVDMLDDFSKRLSAQTKMDFDYFSSFFSETNIVASSRELYPESYLKKAEQAYCFIGRQPADGNLPNRPVLENAPPLKDLLVYMGEIEDVEQAERMNDIIKQLSASGLSAYIITRNLDQWATEEVCVSTNVVCHTYLPIEEYLKQVRVFVSHGGLSSISEAAMEGLPMLLIPTSGERLINARRIQELGAGVMMSGDVASFCLLDRIGLLLADDSYNVRSRRLGASLRNASTNLSITLENVL